MRLILGLCQAIIQRYYYSFFCINFHGWGGSSSFYLPLNQLPMLICMHSSILYFSQLPIHIHLQSLLSLQVVDSATLLSLLLLVILILGMHSVLNMQHIALQETAGKMWGLDIDQSIQMKRNNSLLKISYKNCSILLKNILRFYL